MKIVNAFTERFQLQHPVIQAPMAGGGDTPELVAAVSGAGGLGFIGAAYLTPQQIAETAAAVRAKTQRPFGINLFAPQPVPEKTAEAEQALRRVAPFYEELGLPLPTLSATTAGNQFDQQLEAALRSGASALSFTFGLLPESAIQSAKRQRLYVMGTATTVAEAITLQQAGVDAVVMQGYEAGGHRGTFSGDFAASMIGTMALVPQAVDALSIPVIASGGIMDGRGIAAALSLGASAVQMGTAFLTCHEAGIPAAYQRAILAAQENGTRVTRAFSGRPARGIVNRFMQEVESGDENEHILPFPLQNALTRPLRTAAAKAGRAEFLSLWAGQGARLARQQSAANLVERLGRELDAALARLCQQER